MTDLEVYNAWVDANCHSLIATREFADSIHMSLPRLHDIIQRKGIPEEKEQMLINATPPTFNETLSVVKSSGEAISEPKEDTSDEKSEEVDRFSTTTKKSYISRETMEQIKEMVFAGKTNAEIGHALNISMHTIAYHACKFRKMAKDAATKNIKVLLEDTIETKEMLQSDSDKTTDDIAALAAMIDSGEITAAGLENTFVPLMKQLLPEGVVTNMSIRTGQNRGSIDVCFASDSKVCTVRFDVGARAEEVTTTQR